MEILFEDKEKVIINFTKARETVTIMTSDKLRIYTDNKRLTINNENLDYDDYRVTEKDYDKLLQYLKSHFEKYYKDEKKRI